MAEQSTTNPFIQAMAEEEKKKQQNQSMADPAQLLGRSAIVEPDGMGDKQLKAYNAQTSLLPEEDKSYFDRRLKELQARSLTARKEYQDSKQRTEWLEVAETLGHAMTQLGAAAQGLKTGVDMSGVKFNKNNWDRSYNNLLKELDSKMEELRGDRTGLREEVQSAQEAAKEQARLKREQDKEAKEAPLREAKLEGEKATTAYTKAKTEEVGKEKPSAADKKTIKEQQIARGTAVNFLTALQAEDTSKKLKESYIKDLPKVLARTGLTEKQQADIIARTQEEVGGAKILGMETSFGAKPNYAGAIELLKSSIPEAPAGPEEMVLVVNPKGQRGKIPKSQLPEALKQGYKIP